MTLEYMTTMELYETLYSAEDRLMRLKQIASDIVGKHNAFGSGPANSINIRASLPVADNNDHPAQIRRLTKSASAHLLVLQ